jgi:Ca2+-transporting ATPase
MLPKLIWYARSPEDVFTALETSPAGLGEEEAARRLKTLGANALPRQGTDGPWILFWRQLNNPIGWLLIIAGALALFLGKQTDATVVLGAILVNATIGFFQEHRANKAIEELATMVPETA